MRCIETAIDGSNYCQRHLPGKPKSRPGITTQLAPVKGGWRVIYAEDDTSYVVVANARGQTRPLSSPMLKKFKAKRLKYALKALEAKGGVGDTVVWYQATKAKGAKRPSTAVRAAILKAGRVRKKPKPLKAARKTART